MVADDPESFADLDGHCDANNWCGTFAGIAGGINSAVNHAYDGIVATLKDPLAPVSAAVQFADNGLKAYETKGVSGVLSDLAAQGREGATEIVTEAVLTGGLAAAANSSSKGTVTRYMGEAEAETATKTGQIPNTNAAGEPRPTHVTTDKPIDSASAAQSKYELPNKPTHRATVPAGRAGKLEPTPDGRPTTSGGGSQAATNKPIPVKPKEIKPLNN